MLAEIRAALISDLSPLNVPVHIPWPDRVNPPCAIVGLEQGAYVVGGQTFGSFEVRMTVTLLVAKALADPVAALESLIELTLANTVDWALTGVDAPGTDTISGMELLGTTIQLAKQSKL